MNARIANDTGLASVGSAASQLPTAERKLIAEKLRLALDEIETGRGVERLAIRTPLLG